MLLQTTHNCGSGMQVFKSLPYMMLLVIVSMISATLCSAQITSNVLMRVMMIQTSNGQATSFTIDVDGREYLITAKHVVADLKAEDSINIRDKDNWLPVKVKIFPCDDPVDIAVLVPPVQLTVNFPLEPTSKGMFDGQDMFFVGFPFGMSSGEVGMNHRRPLGLIKKGVLSGFMSVNGANRILLDGYNIFGFSGAPIVYRDLNQSGFEYKVAGVVSGFRPDFEPVLQPQPIEQKDIKPEDITQGLIRQKNGHFFKLIPTENEVQLNSGIVQGFQISHAVEIIHKHPIGPKVTGDFIQ